MVPKTFLPLQAAPPSGVVFSDLDGTLLRSDHTLSPTDRQTLEDLKSRGIIRVIATGRSLQSFRQAVDDDFPADYVIFSTGAGVASLDQFKIIKSSALNREEIERTLRVLREAKIDFMLHHPIPDNHTFAFESNGTANPDFATRLSMHASWGEPLDAQSLWTRATQFVAIFPPEQEVGIIDEIRSKLADLSIIRATSPFDHSSTWMEIFPGRVSKGTAASWLCHQLGLSPHDSMSIGNDYNDLDILEHTGSSYVVANAPADLRDHFDTVSSNNDNGVSQAIAAWMHSRRHHD